MIKDGTIHLLIGGKDTTNMKELVTVANNVKHTWCKTFWKVRSIHESSQKTKQELLDVMDSRFDATQAIGFKTAEDDFVNQWSGSPEIRDAKGSHTQNLLQRVTASKAGNASRQSAADRVGQRNIEINIGKESLTEISWKDIGFVKNGGAETIHAEGTIVKKKPNVSG